MSNSTRCAACKYLRRRCAQDCILAPHFPANNPQRFACVHRIFGASNISRMLQQLPVEKREEAAECMSLEAAYRVRDPVYGCVGLIDQLHQQISTVESELAKTQGEIAFYRAQQAEQPEMAMASAPQGEPSVLDVIQEPSFLNVVDPLPDYYQLNNQIWR